MTRWQQFYLEDPRLAAIKATAFSRQAVATFRQYQKHKILDLACGTGRDSFYLADQALDVTAGDLAWSGLEIARQAQFASPRKPVDFVQMDARCLPFKNNAFEGVYCFGLLHEFTQPDGWQAISEVMDGIHRVLAPGGILLLAVLSGDPLQGLPHVLLFDEAMFDRVARAFTIIEKQVMDDLGCTGRSDYRTWQGIFRKNCDRDEPR